ncbi:MAG: 4-hydroxy-tetrahydrodipicolinate reductase [Candidatus Eremiobacteraeota bacterium]|nr:4-hydroxy-tetrahydrodipicolinate reductase [Candidatus Eremiobacteraeota bacterium]
MSESADIPVVIAGANGRMGRQAVQAVLQQVDMQLVAAFGKARGVGEDVGELSGGSACGVILEDDVESAIAKGAGGVLVDFTLGPAVKNNVLTALRHDMSCIVGATAIPGADEQEIAQSAIKKGVLFAPNFALGAVLMMKFATQAAKYFRWAEIIEYHHERKLDAPSGTARRTADLMRQARDDGFRTPVDSEESVKGVRGGSLGGLRIHSVRLPGKLAHQEVILAAPGEILTIKHDASNRESYMPGMLLAIREVKKLTGLVVGLENILE